jgi:hypothetical protein
MKYPDSNGKPEFVSDFQENYEVGATFRLFWYDKTLAWIWMIFEARRKSQKGKLIKGKTPMNDRCIDIPYASFIGSRSFLAKAWGWSEQSVRTFLKNLQKLDMIEIKVVQNLTMITICNFEDYQNPLTKRQPIVNQNDNSTVLTKVSSQKPTIPEKKNAPEIIKYFCELYKHYFEIEYLPTWQRDTGIINTLWIKIGLEIFDLIDHYLSIEENQKQYWTTQDRTIKSFSYFINEIQQHMKEYA